MASLDEDVAHLKLELSALEGARVRIAVFGQPGAGKSSLVNALIGQPLAKVGVHTDTTVEAAHYEWHGVHLIDLPGYDTARFPKENFVAQFELAQVDVCLWVLDGKLHAADTRLYQVIRDELKKTILTVRSKRDVLWQDGKTEDELCAAITDDIRAAVAEPGLEVLFVSARTGKGLDELAARIDASLDAAKRERWERMAKAHSRAALEKKRRACERYITLAAVAAAANGVNPIPGLDTAIDLGLLIKLLAELRAAYGFDGDTSRFGTALPLLAPQFAKIVQVATKEGVMALVRRYATRELARNATRFVPIVGPIVSGALGFLVVKKVGDYYLEQCHTLAEKVLEAELARR